MANLSEFFSSTSTSRSTFLYCSASETFTAPYDMDVVLHAIGGGGSGALASGSSNGAQATGGGAGGYCSKRVKLTAGQTLTLTVGAGGLGRVSAAGSNLTYAGNDGGNTTILGTGIFMTANGGKGGVALNTSSTSVAASAGGAGGAASGGDKNFTGGRGGNLIPATFANNVYPIRASGGGGVNLFGLGNCNGGDFTGTPLVGTYPAIASGGGGVAASAPEQSSTSFNSAQGADALRLGLPSNGSIAFTLPDGGGLLGFFTTVGPYGSAHANGASPTYNAGPGCGSGGTHGSNISGTVSTFSSNGGAFAGSGASANTAGSYNSIAGGAGTGAGGGGSVGRSNMANNGSGPGGTGLIALEILS